MTREVISKDELHARFRAQRVSGREHIAFNCPICGTTQSMASLLQAGAPADRIETSVGFSCEGRFSNAGPWPSPKDKSKKAELRRKVRGCDWTLGGLFHIHTLEVELEDGKRSPLFQVASPEEARVLEQALKSRSAERPADKGSGEGGGG